MTNREKVAAAEIYALASVLKDLPGRLTDEYLAVLSSLYVRAVDLGHRALVPLLEELTDTKQATLKGHLRAARQRGFLTKVEGKAGGQLTDGWLAKHRGEDTTKEGYGPKIRLHSKPHIGKVKGVEVTDERLDELYRLLESTPIEANGNKPLGPKSVRHIHNIISAALDSVTDRGSSSRSTRPTLPTRPRNGRSRRHSPTSPRSTITRRRTSSKRCGSRAATGRAMTD
ncbi:hypothetical protein ABZ366_01350 [Streptomyces sp. NPDC005904]|uniref:hypothetical protein n=1 Tax=Streptomyces sp. NPDC005904 TaxID=3154570 RepID=UPI0033C7AF73